MMWVLVASLPPLCWSLSCMLDEYLARHNFVRNSFVFVLISELLAFFIGAFILLTHPEAWNMPVADRWFLVGTGLILTAALVPYMMAMKQSEATVIVPLYQLIPAFVLLLGWWFLGESVDAPELAAVALIIAAAIGIVWDFKSHRIGGRMLGLMVLSSFMVSIYTILMRYQTFEHDFLSVAGWMMVGVGAVAWLTFAFYRPWRQEALSMCRAGGFKLSTIFMSQAFLDLAASLIFIKALALAPAAGLAQALNGLQPFYIFVFSFLFGILFPHLYARMQIDGLLLWRVFCVVVLFAGVTILAL